MTHKHINLIMPMPTLSYCMPELMARTRLSLVAVLFPHTDHAHLIE